MLFSFLILHAETFQPLFLPLISPLLIEFSFFPFFLPAAYFAAKIALLMAHIVLPGLPAAGRCFADAAHACRLIAVSLGHYCH